MIPGGVASKKTVLFIPGHRLFVYTRGCLFTPAASRWRALRWPVQSCRAVVAAFTWLASGQRWLAVLLQGSLSNFQYRRWPGSTVEGSRLRQRGVYCQPRVWAGSAGQQPVYDPRPLFYSFPSLSIGTSHQTPRRQSREGFGGGLLKSR